MRERPATPPRFATFSAAALAGVGLLFASMHCGSEVNDGTSSGSGGDGGSGASAGAGGTATDVNAGGAGGDTNTGGTGMPTETITGTTSCYQDNVVDDPPPLPTGYPKCDTVLCDNPTGTPFEVEIQVEPFCEPSNNGSCCGYPWEPAGGPGLQCAQNQVYLNANDECCILDSAGDCTQ